MTALLQLKLSAGVKGAVHRWRGHRGADFILKLFREFPEAGQR